MTTEEWNNSPQNPRNNPRLSPEEHQRLVEEALATNDKWDVQEKINARRMAELGLEPD